MAMHDGILSEWSPAGQFKEPVDVTADGFVAPVDALAVINQINSAGSELVAPDAFGGPYFDVDGDGWIAPADALAVIYFINELPQAEAESPVPDSQGKD